MCKDNGEHKAYGAGIISSFGELEYCKTDVPKLFPLDPYEIAQNNLSFPISSMQPHYYVAESFTDAKRLIVDYCENISKPFNVTYNKLNHTVEVDRKIHTRMEVLPDTGYDGPLYEKKEGQGSSSM